MEDGSGGIVARDVRGDFTLRRDGSGGVDVEADGTVTLPRGRQARADSLSPAAWRPASRP